MDWLGATIEGVSNSWLNKQDQFHSAWFMNENQKQQDHMFDRGLAAESTAMQRRVRDLEAAGLSPLLAIRGGEGAGSPGSGSASGGSAIPSHRSNAGALLAQTKLTNAQAAQLQTSSALQAAETKKVLDTLPALVRSMSGEASRKEFGKGTVERSEENMNQFFKFLERVGGSIGSSAYEYHQKVKNPLDVIHGENRGSESNELSPAAREWRAKRRKELYGKE